MLVSARLLLGVSYSGFARCNLSGGLQSFNRCSRRGNRIGPCQRRSRLLGYGWTTHQHCSRIQSRGQASAQCAGYSRSQKWDPEPTLVSLSRTRHAPKRPA
ncbi:hypothetical protein EXIGLDRAFT_517015 [Exidia glandulosa HHB12029]|uniref:Uncharacterized protein n=1 Tax=Exidia glandulosa HHB12029 TaxID=1314781 RepID=A0A165J801_EXIGL|nr:hypothetical protein EXIGLDRAFT_517015 [Exidia glandulosa HHB12029]